ncbi:type II secretion system F family protein [Ruania alba]|uniref:type II secretion system F family protein n=1 Tax=Ruania alba TaxID=648782 RepID=UPI000B7F9313|nr:type II secretion system F family protein [Ruania alba]
MLALVVATLAAVALLPWALARAPARSGERSAGAGRRGRGPLPRADTHVDEAVLLDLAGAALGAGASVPTVLDALGHALPVAHGEPLLRVVAALRLGASWDEAWQAGGDPVPVHPLRSALGPAWRDGVDPGPLLAQAAATIRARRGSRAREAAARLGVRLVLPLGICLLPAFVLLGLMPVLLSTGSSLFGP